MPFVSGKDSLNNEFSYADAVGQARSVAIPPSLLITALGQVADVATCVSMDLKEPGNLLMLVGLTHDELGGSHFGLVTDNVGGAVPQVDAALAKKTFAAVHRAIVRGTVRACHDLSEGGLAAAVAEMAFAGGCGALIFLDRVPHDLLADEGQMLKLLFAESNTRFVCEVPAEDRERFKAEMDGVPYAEIGRVTENKLEVLASAQRLDEPPLLSAELNELKAAWQSPLSW